MTFTLEKSIETKKESIEVGFFYEMCHKLFQLSLVAKNQGFQRKITDPNIHRPGLALAGFVKLFAYNRVQVFGNTEVAYLAGLTQKQKAKSLKNFFSFPIPCIIFTNNNKPDEVFLKFAKEKKVTIFSSKKTTTQLVYYLSDFLDDQFSSQITLHGSFIDVYGVGILFVGRSGIGKSEIALDLIERGHRLVADDVVIVTKKGEGLLIGAGSTLVKHFMEIRGLGIINVEKLFGIRSVRFQKRIEVIVILEEWNSNSEYTRTGLEQLKTDILGVDVPTVKLPIFPGKNITVIAEVIALNYLLSHYGYDAAIDLSRKLKLKIQKKRGSEMRVVSYFEHDFE